MGINKVIYGDRTLIDLTADTVTAEKLSPGYTAHQANGEIITGTLANAPIAAYVTDFNKGYVNNGTWTYESPTNNYVDIYQVLSGHKYFITLGANVSTRFRAMFSSVDVSQVTEEVAGETIINKNIPDAYDNTMYSANANGYIIILKSSTGKTGIKTYVYDATAGWL